MTNKQIRSALAALALLSALTLAAGAQDRALDGTWLGDEGLELRLGNGNLELRLNHEELETGFMFLQKGTFSSSGGNITVTYTHVHGSLLHESGIAIGIRSDGWYTLDEIEAAVRRTPGGEFSAPFIRQQFAPMFITETAPVSNNRFTLQYGTFTRQ